MGNQARRKAQVDQKSLSEVVEEVLRAQPRGGVLSPFTAEQIVQIIAIACEKPAASKRPISHWRARELAEEAVKRKIVEQISVRTVGRFLKSGGVKTGQSGVLVDGKTRCCRSLCGRGERDLWAV